MRTEKHNGHTIEMYDTIGELSVTRWHLFNKYIMMQAGIGGDIETIDQHITSILKMIRNEDLDDASNEVMNMRQNMAYVIQRLSPEMLAFAAMVKSIDGKMVSEETDSGFEHVCKVLARKRMRWGFMSQIVNELKKNSTRKLRLTFQM